VKARGEGRMRHHGGDIGEDVLGSDRRALRLGERQQDFRAHVRLRRLRIGPECVNTAAERAFVVILIGNQIR
jgi:hypothetical protein